MFGATVADGVFFVFTYFGVAAFVTPAVRNVLYVLGGALMLYLALSTVKSARRKEEESAPSASRRPSVGGSPFLLGLSIGLTNPFQLGWWVAIGASMISNFGGGVAAGFFLGILSWTVILTAIVHAGVARYRRLSPVIAYASAALMVGFGLWFLHAGLLSTLP